MENQIRGIIEIAKEIVRKYSEINIYKESFIDNENVLFYSVTLWGDDDKRDLAFYVELYKESQSINPIICNTRKFNLYETLNLENVITALKQLKNAI